MKLSATERNQKIYDLFEALIKSASKTSLIKFQAPFTKDEVETLFIGHIFGHREITLTILLARILDQNFKASENFYACNPRAIFENPIRKLLRKYNIPHMKSGPLNVAKNIQKINEDWAQNKRGGEMALIVAKLVKKIESVPPQKLRGFATAFIQRYLQEAKKVAELKFKIKKIEDPIFLSDLCRDMIVHATDGGSTPQIITGLLIEHFNLSQKNKIKTIGYNDSVSTTNTTSKKAGDVMEVLMNRLQRIYEITVKKFTSDRMIESYAAVKAYDKENKIAEVFVICRKEDTPDEMKISNSGNLIFGSAEYQDIVYYFIDIFGFIQEKLFFMPIKDRGQFYLDLIEYINQINTSEKVKVFFKQWHEQRSFPA